MRYFVAVAEELHFGRAATRLHMSQPPLSRAIKQLEADVGAPLFTRSPTGVTLTPAGTVLLDEARALLDHADRARVRVSAAVGAGAITVGILGGVTNPGVSRLAAAYRRTHPGIDIRIRDTDLTDPTCGLRSGLVDVALTRAPFDETALTVRELRTDPVGVVLRADDPLARRDRLRLAELSDRRWFQFPQDTDPIWQSYWNGGTPREGPVVHAVQECLHAVLWNGTVGLAPLGHDLPAELAVVPLIDMAPSRVVVVCNEGDTNPLIRSFVDIATAAYHHGVPATGAAAAREPSEHGGPRSRLPSW
ncbi:LysR substrate-binding domain-containing protein [Streptomyces sp. NPDC056463]|uniref:LysR substrate-binding domain-containing protein n=2 Tax=Streptomyces TaxID=1883 RepID=UPI0036BE44D5